MKVIVTAFIPDINQNWTKTQYIEWGKKLLIKVETQTQTQTQDNKDIIIVLFTTKEIIEYLDDEKSYKDSDNNKKPNNVIFIEFKREDIYLCEYKDRITNLQIKTDRPEKDTIDYMFLMCHKTEFMRFAIKAVDKIFSHQPQTKFIWIDFGIYHIFNGDDSKFEQCIKNLVNSTTHPNQHNKVRIGSIWPADYIPPYPSPSSYNEKEIYENIAWYFAGGVLGGTFAPILQFADLMKKKCIQIIREKGTIMWEVNIWRLIYLEHPELFSLYSCDHNPTLVENY